MSHQSQSQSQSRMNKSIFKKLEAVLASENQNYRSYYNAFKQLEECLQTYLSSPGLVSIFKDWEYICHIRKLLGIIVIKMIVEDIKTFEKQNMETRLWKVAYYDFYSILRSNCKSSSPHYLACKACILQTITMGIQVFHEMLKTFQASSGISPTRMYEKSLVIQSKTLSTTEYSTLMSAYKILIFLGDLHRYGSSNDEKKNLHNAARCYDQARVIIPEKSRSYHQLAILAKIKNDWINAAYNFVRAHSANCEASRVDLLEIFDDVTKQFRAKESSFWHYRSRMNQGTGCRLVHNTIWVSTDPNDREIPPPFVPPESKEEHLQNLTNQELYKRFCQSYIVFLGKLFTKIGLESLELVAESTLVYFEELLKRNVYISWIRVTQIVTLNLYMIRYINHKFKVNPDTGLGISKLNRMKRSRAYKRPDRLDDAHHMESVCFDFGFEMFSLLVEKLGRIIRLCDWKNVMLGPISIAVQLWISWLKHNSQFWAYGERSRPVFCIRRLMKSKNENARDCQDDVWVAFAELMSQLEILLSRFKTTFPAVTEVQDEAHGCSIGRLPECIFLAGFDMFIQNKFMNREYFVPSKFDIEKAFLYVRLRRIYGFGKDVVKKVKILKRTPGFYKVNQYSSMARIIQPNEETIKNSCGQRENDYQVLLARFRRNLDLSASQMKGNKQPIKSKRKGKITGDCNNARFIVHKPKVVEALEPTRARMANYEAWVLMAEFGFPADLVVCPKRVVLDTNCLINDLVYIDCLIPHLRYPLLIPVTVILELRGLSKGGLTNKEKKLFGSVHNPEAKEVVAKNEKTAQNCKLVLRFIEQHIGAFRIITSTGRYVNPDSLYDFMRDDYYDQASSNDERILDSCKYMEYTDPETRPLDTPLRVFRNTILVSGDRILRLRTITLDIPTRTTASFCFWFFKAHNTNFRPRFHFGTKYPLSFQFPSVVRGGQNGYEEEEEEEEDESLLNKAALKKKRRAKKRGRIFELHPQMYRL